MPRFGSPLDADGQPFNRCYNAKRIAERGLDELIGLCKGCIADGFVHQREAEYLLKWLEGNAHVADEWPANVIAARIEEYLRDGHLDDQERADLFDLLSQATGEGQLRHLADNKSTELPIDTPPPDLLFEQRLFCFTGKFVFGTRAQCEREILTLGGQVASTITQKTNYLVVGLLGSRDWMHSTHGRKIEAAVQLRDRGLPISIVSEDHWAEQIACACI